MRCPYGFALLVLVLLGVTAAAVGAQGTGAPVSAAGVQAARDRAERGNADAQHNLGVMYATGQGVRQDYVEAHKWEYLAASRATRGGQAVYAKAADTVAAEMTPAQIAKAQKLAREWAAAFRRRWGTELGAAAP